MVFFSSHICVTRVNIIHIDNFVQLGSRLHFYCFRSTENIESDHPDVQLNEYETAPYFLHFLRQKMRRNCLFTFVFSLFLPEFTCFVPKIGFFCDVQNNFRHKTGKNGEKHKSKQIISCHV